MSVPAKVRAAVSDGDKTLGCRREVADLLSEGGDSERASWAAGQTNGQRHHIRKELRVGHRRCLSGGDVSGVLNF